MDENNNNGVNSVLPPQKQNKLVTLVKKIGPVKLAIALVFVALAGFGVYSLIGIVAPGDLIASIKVDASQVLTDSLKANSKAIQSSLPQSAKPTTTELEKTATSRKDAMVKLAKSDPDKFLSLALGAQERAALPADVKAQVEEPVAVDATYQGDKVLVNGRTYNADYNKSQALYIDPGSTTKINGYILGDEFVFGSTPNNYKPNVRSTTSNKPSKNIKFDGQVMVGGLTSGTTGTEGTGTVISGVPGYAWRDGCCPTALGMVIGYWDGHGYPDLIPGDATTQTAAVNQMISSHATFVGDHESYEDYALPMEASGSTTALPDKSELPTGDEHPWNSLADLMHTSWSVDGTVYGSSYGNWITPTFSTYVKSKYPAASVSTVFYWGTKVLTFDILKQEVNAGRPVQLGVDTTGDGLSDHCVTAVGYRETNGYPEYASWDTWSTTILRWQRFRPMSNQYTWGVGGGWTNNITNTPTKPTISSFTATPASVTTGQTSTLAWSTSGATSVSINQNVGTVAASGSKAVNPTATTTYTLSATNTAGTVTQTVTVTATPPAGSDTTAPIVSITGVTNGATYTSGTLYVVGHAADASGIAQIQIYLNGNLQTTCSNATTCQRNISLKHLRSGSFVVKVVATDKANPANSASNVVTFTRG